MPTTTVNAPDGTPIKVRHPEGATEEQIIAYAKEQSPRQDRVVRKQYGLKGDEDQSAAETVARVGGGLAAEIGIGEGGRIGGAIAGTAVMPGIGTAVGYVAGGLASGAAGSIARQRIMRPDAEIRWGEVVADSLINLIPGSKAVKGGRMAGRIARSAGKGAATGTAIGEAGLLMETAFEEQRLPTLDEIYSRGITAGLLGGGLGVSGEGFTKAYQKFAGMPSSHLTDAYKAGDADAKVVVDGIERNAKEYAESRQRAWKEAWAKFRQTHDDELIKARELQNQSGGGQYVNKNGILEVVNDESDYYMQRRLAEATIQNRNKKIAETIDLDADFLRGKAKELGVEQGRLSDSVDEFLYAQHAITYNRVFGDGAAGISTDEAANLYNKFKKSGLDQELAPSITMRRDSANEILDVLVEGGLVSPTVATSLRKKYPDYVPLNRVMGEVDVDDQILAPLTQGSGKYESFGSGLRRAKGSEREVRNITQNIYENLAGAVRRAEVNKANLAFKRLIEANPESSAATIRKPKAVGKTHAGQPIMEDARNNVLTVFDAGQKHFVEFKDPDLARVFKGSNRHELAWWLKAAYAHNRFIGGMMTRMSPDFLVPNLFRDRQEAFVNSLAKMKHADAIKMFNPVADMVTIERNLRQIPARNPKEKELDDLYARFREAGGSTGGLGLSTVKHIEDEIGAMAANLRQPSHQLAKKMNVLINQVNEVFEDATRFGAFRRGRSSGMTDQQAALAARDSSFDPLLKGTQGDAMKALWLFSNPAVQSIKNFSRSMSKPSVALPVMTALTGVTLAFDRWNQRYDPDWREKLKTQEGSNWKVNKHFIMVYGKNDDDTLKYASIPVGYSAVPFKFMADKLQQIATGQKVGTPAEIADELKTEVIDTYNPMGGSPVPTPFRPILELMSNTDGLGRDVRPEWLENKNMSAVEKVYPWTAETYGGELAMSLAGTLDEMKYETSPENLLYLYRFYTGGPGATVKRLFDVTSKLWNKEPVNSSDIPIARRFFGQTYAQAFERRNGEKQIIDNIEKQENTEAAVSSRISYNYYQKYLDAGGGAEGFQSAMMQMRNDEDVDAAVMRRFTDRVEAHMRGITYTDQEISNLGVKSGARAKAYMEIVKNMEPEARVQYLQEQIQKGILTEEVQKQMFINSEVRRLFRPTD